MFQKISFFFFLISCFLFPTVGYAANVGFVPSSGLWFSRTTFLPGETVSVYTVVINSDYYALDGTVTFYDNNAAFDTATIVALPKEHVQQVKVFWKPSAGDHALSAKFSKAEAVDDKGNRQAVDIGTINAVAGGPLTINNAAVAAQPNVVPLQNNAEASVAGTAAAEQTLVGQTHIVVQTQGKNLVIVPPPRPSSAPEQTTAPSQSAITASAQNIGSVLSAATTIVTTSQDIFAKNREMIGKAEAVAGTITSTVGTIASAYDKTKNAIEVGKGYVQAGQDSLEKTRPYVDKMAPVFEKLKSWWLSITHNNEPKRVAITIVVLLIVLWMLKRAITPKFIRDYGQYKR